MDLLISEFWHLGEGFRGFGPQIRLQHAEISPGTNSEVIGLELKGFPKICLVAIQWPEGPFGGLGQVFLAFQKRNLKC